MLCGVVNAQGTWDYIDDFSGGLNTFDLPNVVSKSQALVLKNGLVAGKSLSKRKDFTQIAAKFGSDGVRAAYSYYNGTSRVTSLVAVAGNAGYVSVDDGRTWTMFYTDSGVTVTNGSMAVVAADSGDFRQYRDLYMSYWIVKLPAGNYTVSSWAISGDADPDTMYLTTPYSGSNGSSKAFQLSPYISDGYVDFETWMNNLYIADGFSPVKVWDGRRFRPERAKRGYAVVDSFKANAILYPAYDCAIVTIGYPTPTMSKWTQYADAHYCLVYADSTGTGEEVSKPIPIYYVTAQKFALEGMTRWDIDTTQYIFVTWPPDPSYTDYEVVDSGSFERVVKVDSLYACQTYDYVDNDKSWSAVEYNYDNTMIVFDNPATKPWYTFRNIARSTGPDTVAVRITFDNRVSVPSYNGEQRIDSSLTRQPRTYKIIRMLHSSYDNMPSAQFVQQQADVMWYGRLQDAPSRVIVSDPSTDSVFAVEFDAGGEDGDVLTGLFPIFNYIYTIKSDGIQQITGNSEDDLQQSPQSYDFGLKSSQLFFQHRSSFVGFNDQGFYVFSGGQLELFSQTITNLIEDSLNWAQTAIMDGVDAGKYFAIALPYGSASVNNRTFTYDLRTNAWSEWTGLRVGCWLVNNKVSTADTLTYFDADSGAVYVYGREFDDDFDFVYQSPFINNGESSIEKNLNSYMIEGHWDAGDSIRVSLFVNSSSTAAVQVDTIVSTGSGKASVYVRQTAGAVRGFDYSMKVESMTCDTMTLSRVGFNVTPTRELRR